MENSKSPEITNQPFLTTVTVTADSTRRGLSDLADAAADGYYAHAVEKNADKSAFLIHFYSFDPAEEAELRGRLIIGAELMGIDGFEILSVTTERCADKNWLEEVHQAFPPRVLGKFFVYGSHYEGPSDSGYIPLKIDAATAFGSGEHDTTQLCLEMLSKLKDKEHDFKNILDMGCGSAILAIGAQKLWPDANVMATDIDAESVRVARRHAEMNDAVTVSCDCGDGYRVESVQTRAPFDLVIANILTRPLIAMAPDLSAVTATGGLVILSGLLARQAQDVVRAHVENGFEIRARMEQNNWACLLLEKEAAA